MAESIQSTVTLDIAAVEGLAVALSDTRKSALETAAAAAATELYEETKGRATDAGAKIASNNAKLSYWQGEAMTAEGDEAIAAADAEVTILKEEIKEQERT